MAGEQCYLSNPVQGDRTPTGVWVTLSGRCVNPIDPTCQGLIVFFSEQVGGAPGGTFQDRTTPIVWVQQVNEAQFALAAIVPYGESGQVRASFTNTQGVQSDSGWRDLNVTKP